MKNDDANEILVRSPTTVQNLNQRISKIPVRQILATEVCEWMTTVAKPKVNDDNLPVNDPRRQPSQRSQEFRVNDDATGKFLLDNHHVLESATTVRTCLEAILASLLRTKRRTTRTDSVDVAPSSELPAGVHPSFKILQA